MEEDRLRKEGDDDGDQGKYVCEKCGKEFKSVKAVGGHMRIHSKRERSGEVENDVIGVDRAADCSSEMEDERDALVVGGKPICPICGRDFPSNKALFGHMRCHPERRWRGIQPPVCSSPSSTVSDDDVIDYCDDDDRRRIDLVKRFPVVDLEKDLLSFGWGAKAVRGREARVKSAVGSQNVLECSIPPDQAAGVESLMLLSRGGLVDEGSGKSEVESEKQLLPAGPVLHHDSINFMKKLDFTAAETPEASGSNEKRRRNSQVLMAEEISGLVYSANKIKLNVAIENGKEKIGADGTQDRPTESDQRGRQMQGTECEAKMQGQKVRKYLMVNNMKAMPLNLHHSSPVKLHHQVSMEVEPYRCTTCNKSFLSHQALGGHKASHNKSRNAHGFKNNDHPLQENNGTAEGGDNSIVLHAGERQNVELMAGPYVHPLHQCNVCFKIYPTGQALGGHKRLHWSLATSKPPESMLPAIVNHEPEAAPPAAQANSDSNAGEVCNNFDLNELPPLDQDDGDHDQDAIIQSVDNIAAQPQQGL